MTAKPDADADVDVDVDVVIVAYRSATTIAACVRSARASAVVREVIVVDNSSPDDSADAA